jgi:hypothetical protein
MASVTFPLSLGGDGTTVTDDSAPTTGLGNGGHRVRFLAAMIQMINVMDYGVTTVDASTLAAAGSASAAAASAAASFAGAGGVGTSTSSMVVGTGAKTLTTQTGKTFVPGQTIVAADTAAPATNYMVGIITSYTTGTGALAFTSSYSQGSGTLTSWQIALTGAFDSTRAPLASPALTGNPTAPTQAKGNVTTRLATTAFVEEAKKFTLVTRTSDTIIATTNLGNMISVSGTWTQTYPSAATLSSGWWCRFRNTGTGTITHDPNGSQTIDGLATRVQLPGEQVIVYSDGSNLFTIVEQPFYLKATTSGTFPKPTGYRAFGLSLFSGGSSGKKGGTGTASPGGGGGGCAEFLLDASLVGVTEVMTVGAGGAAATTVGAQNDGGDTSFGSLAVVYGANASAGGSVSDIIASQHSDGYGAGDGGNSPGYSVYGGGGSGLAVIYDSGTSIFGGGAGGGVSSAGVVKLPGSSKMAGSGGAASSAASGSDGAAPAGGGGGTQTGTQSGAGGRGELRIWGII